MIDSVCRANVIWVGAPIAGIRWRSELAVGYDATLPALEPNDPRVRVEEQHVRSVMSANPGRFDAVLLDTDNESEALSAASNVGLYNRTSLAIARRALAHGGTLVARSVADDPRFRDRLKDAGFTVRTERVRRRPKSRGHRDVILVAEPRVS